MKVHKTKWAGFIPVFLCNLFGSGQGTEIDSKVTCKRCLAKMRDKPSKFQTEAKKLIKQADKIHKDFKKC